MSSDSSSIPVPDIDFGIVRKNQVLVNARAIGLYLAERGLSKSAIEETKIYFSDKARWRNRMMGGYYDSSRTKITMNRSLYPPLNGNLLHELEHRIDDYYGRLNEGGLKKARGFRFGLRGFYILLTGLFLAILALVSTTKLLFLVACLLCIVGLCIGLVGLRRYWTNPTEVRAREAAKSKAVQLASVK